jgi:hypothetical protein
MPSCLFRIGNNGTLYIADTYNHRIMRYWVNETSGTVVAGGNGQGTGTNQLNNPFSFTYDVSSDSLLIANYDAHTVVRWALGATSWTLLAGQSGSPGSSSTLLNAPLRVFLDVHSNLYVADTRNHRIQLFRPGESNGTTIAGSTGSPGIAANQLRSPFWAILDKEMNLIVSDTFNHRVVRFRRL